MIRTTVDIPEPLHDLLRNVSQQTGNSIRSLIIRALEQTYRTTQQTRQKVTGPLVRGKGQLGPDFPVDENPHDVVFS